MSSFQDLCLFRLQPTDLLVVGIEQALYQSSSTPTTRYMSFGLLTQGCERNTHRS